MKCLSLTYGTGLMEIKMLIKVQNRLYEVIMYPDGSCYCPYLATHSKSLTSIRSSIRYWASKKPKPKKEPKPIKEPYDFTKWLNKEHTKRALKVLCIETTLELKDGLWYCEYDDRYYKSYQSARISIANRIRRRLLKYELTCIK